MPESQPRSRCSTFASSDPETDEAWNKWLTTRPLRIEADGWLDVPIDFETDLVSVPNAFSWFIPRAWRFARAAVLHDRLWKLADKKQYDRRDADRQFRVALEKSGVSPPRRWIMWAAVRLASIFVKHDGGESWWMDLPAVTALTLVALPFVMPPAVLILPATFAFFALERAAHAVSRPENGERRKEAPKVQLWT